MKAETIECAIDKVFGGYPKEPYTFNITTRDSGSLDIILLTHFMLAGTKKLFGNVNPLTMSEKQFHLLQDYMKSMGYVVKYSFGSDKVKIWFERYIPTTRCNGIIIP